MPIARRGNVFEERLGKGPSGCFRNILYVVAARCGHKCSFIFSGEKKTYFISKISSDVPGTSDDRGP